MSKPNNFALRAFLLFLVLSTSFPIAPIRAHASVEKVYFLPAWFTVGTPSMLGSISPDSPNVTDIGSTLSEEATQSFTTTHSTSRPVVEPALLQAIAQPSEEPVAIIVILNKPLQLERLTSSALTDAEHDPVYARATMVDALRENWSQSLRPLTPLLNTAESQGQILARRDLWIINGVALTVEPELLETLLTSPWVSELRLDTWQQYIAPTPEPLTEALRLAEDGLTWGVERIRAPKVWASLNITGTGAVVAGMDTGAELNHPALYTNYRGNLGRGVFDHRSSWFDVVNDGIYPYDDYGHGAHTLGTAVGQGGIGVAPGARWIAVKTLSHDGYAYNSWIHEAFQWLLAPGGDPAMAPDVVNCSWSASNGRIMTFEEDIAILKAAGILPVFSAGNEGPGSSTVGSPASLPGVFSVGATDPDDEIAQFSSRGPSPWLDIKPEIVAPGVIVRSAVPGGIYEEWNGTSMAAPHVAGVAALMRSVSPTIDVQRMVNIFTATAEPLAEVIPNNDCGWGLVDAFGALAQVVHPAQFVGTIRGLGGMPLVGATISAKSHTPDGGNVRVTTDVSGTYHLVLVPGMYDLTVSAFGYADQMRVRVEAITGTLGKMNFTLFMLPGGIVEGHVTVAPTGEVPTRPVTVHVLDRFAKIVPDEEGYYALALPAGSHTLAVRGNGYRVATAVVTLSLGSVYTQDFALEKAPTLLLVDEGAWYYEEELSYWREALDTLGYVYDSTRIKHVHEDTPSSTVLMNYDTVLWSSPSGSPGLVYAEENLSTYLENGGRLLVSGQDVAYHDVGGSILRLHLPYLYEQTGVYFVKDDAGFRELTGVGPFEGLNIQIEGGDGADNQDSPDIVGIHNPFLATSVWHYEDGGLGGVGASLCVPYRSLFFSFGFEAISDATTRSEVMDRSLKWLYAPPPKVQLNLGGNSELPIIGDPGQQVTHTLYLQHAGRAGTPDTVTLKLAGFDWPTVVTPTQAVLNPCDRITLHVKVRIPNNAADNTLDEGHVIVESSQTSKTPTVTLRTKTPAPILLLDDDRWYPMEEYYEEALQVRGIAYDIWSTHHEIAGRVGAYSPLTDTLRRYPIILWFTGYDWYKPIREEEEQRLLTYLSEGGRLLLSSQEFLYQHFEGPLACSMGVQSFSEYLKPEKAAGVPDHPAGGIWGPVRLMFPFKNWADVVEPIPEAEPVVRGQQGQPLAIASTLADTAETCDLTTTQEGGRTLFYGFPIEAIPLTSRAEALARAVDWLSPLGQSTWSVTPTVVPGSRVMNGTNTIIVPPTRVTATARLHNDAQKMLSVVLSYTLPPSLTLVPGTLSPLLNYNALERRITWAGRIGPAASLDLGWEMMVAQGVPTGLKLDPVLRLKLPEWGGMTIQRQAPLRVGGGNLEASTWLSGTKATFSAAKPLTLTFALRNTGPDVLEKGEVRLWMMPGVSPITETLFPLTGTEFTLWQGSLAPSTTQILSMPLKVWLWDTPIRVDALLQDENFRRWETSLQFVVRAHNIYLPMMLKGSQVEEP